MREDRAVTYLSDSKGTAIHYDAVCACASRVRAGKPIRSDWAATIRADVAERETK